jgi:hypothetical protein
MILNLEAKKAVDSSKRVSIVSGYTELCSVDGIFGLIGDIAFQPLHGFYTWRHGSMDKHRNSKIALGKLYCDHCQMLTDCLLASCISRLVALYLDSTAVSQQMEVVGCLFVARAF